MEAPAADDESDRSDRSEGSEALIEAFWAQFRSAQASDSSGADRWFWAWEAVREVASRQDDAVVPLLTRLADAVPGDVAALAYLGAGPIEDLVCGGTTASILDQLDAAARQNPNMRNAIRCVSWGGVLDSAVIERFARFGPSL